jgi:hypothetical protein
MDSFKKEVLHVRKKGRGYVMTDARGHNVKKMKTKGKRKMIRGEGKYTIRHFVCVLN